MASKNKDFSPLLKSEHFGKWVALSEDRSKILGYAENLKSLRGKIEAKNAFFTKVLNPHRLYAF